MNEKELVSKMKLYRKLRIQAEELEAEIKAECTKSTVDWRKVAQDAGVTTKDIEATAVEANSPSVSFKITEI